MSHKEIRELAEKSNRTQNIKDINGNEHKKGIQEMYESLLKLELEAKKESELLKIQDELILYKKFIVSQLEKSRQSPIFQK